MEYKGNTINVVNNYIEFNNKRVRIIDNSEYTYKFNKASISAQGGATGLIEFMNECITENFGLVWVDAIIEKMQKIALEECIEKTESALAEHKAIYIGIRKSGKTNVLGKED